MEHEKKGNTMAWLPVADAKQQDKNNSSTGTVRVWCVCVCAYTAVAAYRLRIVIPRWPLCIAFTLLFAQSTAIAASLLCRALLSAVTMVFIVSFMAATAIRPTDRPTDHWPCFNFSRTATSNGSCHFDPTSTPHGGQLYSRREFPVMRIW